MAKPKMNSRKPKTYLIERHQSIDEVMLDRYIERGIVPAFDLFPEFDLQGVVSDQLLNSPEIAAMSTARQKEARKALAMIKSIQKGDWIAILRPQRDELIVGEVETYVFIQYQAHLQIKHYIKIDNSFTIAYDRLPPQLLSSIMTQTGFTELPDEMYSVIHIQKSFTAPQPVKAPPDTAKKSEMIKQASDAPRAEAPTSEQVAQMPPQSENEPVKKQPKPIRDNQIVSSSSLSVLQRKTDSVSAYKRLHVSIFAMQDYLRTNMPIIREIHLEKCDLAFCGEWHDGARVEIKAYSLSDQRGNVAWLMKLSLSNAEVAES